MRGNYRPDDMMATLACDNRQILPLLSRFNIPLGFAEATIEDVCTENGVDCTTFLALSNLILRSLDAAYKPALQGVQIVQVTDYLRRSHEHYLTTRLPRIREKLLSVLSGDKISTLILRYFDDYVAQIHEHMRFEEDTLFPYVSQLSDGRVDGDFCIAEFCKRHDHIDEPLTEFKDVIIKYYTAPNSQQTLEVIHDLLSCARDLSQHNMIEDRLLVPLICEIEQKVKGGNADGN